MQLVEAPVASFDVLALDAFSSDAVPMHLMTTEAFDTYGRVLDPKGVLLVHISNRFLDLEPVVAAAGARGKWLGARLVYRPPANSRDEEAISDWIALTRDPSSLAKLLDSDSDWVPLQPRPGFRPWSDDYATILPVLRSFREQGAQD